MVGVWHFVVQKIAKPNSTAHLQPNNELILAQGMELLYRKTKSRRFDSYQIIK